MTLTLTHEAYQFMAQMNTNVNVELARDTSALVEGSKDDSSAMKTISIVGMVFRLGAFLAVNS